jgi:hypothetical protein
VAALCFTAVCWKTPQAGKALKAVSFVRADEKLTAFLTLGTAIRARGELP